MRRIDSSIINAENVVIRTLFKSSLNTSAEPYIELREHTPSVKPYQVDLCLPLNGSGNLHCLIAECPDEISGRKAYEGVLNFIQQNKGDIFLEDSVRLISHEGKDIDVNDFTGLRIDTPYLKSVNDGLGE